LFLERLLLRAAGSGSMFSASAAWAGAARRAAHGEHGMSASSRPPASAARMMVSGGGGPGGGGGGGPGCEEEKVCWLWFWLPKLFLPKLCRLPHRRQSARASRLCAWHSSHRHPPSSSLTRTATTGAPFVPATAMDARFDGTTGAEASRRGHAASFSSRALFSAVAISLPVSD
jgi:hypothetical protein